MDGSYSTSYGVDGIFKVLKNDYLNVKLAQVMAKTYSNNPLSLDPTRSFLTGSDIMIRGWGTILRIPGVERILNLLWVFSREKIIHFMPAASSMGGYPVKVHC